MRLLGRLAGLVWACCTLVSHADDLEVVQHDGATYQLYRVSRAASSQLEMAWLDSGGKPLGDFNGLQKKLAAEGRELKFATNGGIYEHGPKPCGLAILNSRQLVPLSTKDADGNFYLKPNGVFYVDDKTGPGVMETSRYGQSGLAPRIACQSGPLLLADGKVHPAFNPNSKNRRLRNAVGVRSADQQIIFVMSDPDDWDKGRVTFHQLSQFFLHLGCNDALFLDGDISQMVVNPPLGKAGRPTTFATMFYIASEK